MAAATALLVGATALSAGSSIFNASNQASALRMQGDYQQQIAETNARASEELAKGSIERGKTESALVKGRARQLIGTQRTSYAGQGVDVNSGSAINVQDEAFTMGETDALTVKNNAWREAWGYKTQASNLRSQGRIANLTARTQARNTMLTGGLSAVGSILQAGYLGSK
jgi:hypothetical protein